MWKTHFLLCVCVLAVAAGGIKIGDLCEDDDTCDDVFNAVCNGDDVCACEDGYVPSKSMEECLELATEVGNECEVTEQCSKIPSAVCEGNVCVVHEEPVTAPTVDKPTDGCAINCSTLPVKHICKDGACVLAFPLASPKATGVDLPVLGAPCEKECSAEGAECIDKVCKCGENFVPSLNLKSCLPKAKSVGDKCEETSQCVLLAGSVCENEKCTGKLTKVFSSDDDRSPPLLIGSSCQTDKDCQHLPHARCRENVCQCNDTHVTSVSSNACLEKAKKEGDPCEVDKQCEGVKGATCVQGKCVKPGMVGAKLGKKTNSGSTGTRTVSKLILAAIFLRKMFNL